jgi:uncharacterized membrane protein YheB (UPF0754 family)
MDSESYTQQLSRETVNKLFAFYSAMDLDNETLRHNLVNFVNEFIQIVIAQALSDYDRKAKKKEQMRQVFNNFSNLKDAVEKEIAQSFTNAMVKYAGQEIPYYCLIKRLSEPVNSTPC